MRSLLLGLMMLLGWTIPAWAVGLTTAVTATWQFTGVPVQSTLDYGGAFVFPDIGEVTGPNAGLASGQFSRDDGLMGTSAFLAESGGYASAFNGEHLILTGQESGWSTVTVNYHFEETGSAPFNGLSSLLVRGYGVDDAALIVPNFTAIGLDTARTFDGSFSRSIFFDLPGGSQFLDIQLNSSVTSVPIPDMFWLTVAGFVALFAYWLNIHRGYSRRHRQMY